jgi:uncharacterized protein with PQ loop repeat
MSAGVVSSTSVSEGSLATTGASRAALSFGSGAVLLANVLGTLSSVLFMCMYFPQFLLNHTRRSTQGFSSTGIIIKLVGTSFLSVNAFVMGRNHRRRALRSAGHGPAPGLHDPVFLVRNKEQHAVSFSLGLWCFLKTSKDI